MQNIFKKSFKNISKYLIYVIKLTFSEVTVLIQPQTFVEQKRFLTGFEENIRVMESI